MIWPPLDKQEAVLSHLRLGTSKIHEHVSHVAEHFLRVPSEAYGANSWATQSLEYFDRQAQSTASKAKASI